MIFRKINTGTGFFICDTFEIELLDDGTQDPQYSYITEPVPQGVYHPKWNGEKWVEGLTQEEIAELTKPVPQEPTVEERLQMAEDTIMFMLMGGI